MYKLTKVLGILYQKLVIHTATLETYCFNKFFVCRPTSRYHNKIQRQKTQTRIESHHLLTIVFTSIQLNMELKEN